MTHINATFEVVAKPATGNGDIDGFEVQCSACVERAAFSSRLMTESHGRAHIAYMQRKETKASSRRPVTPRRMPKW